MTIHSKPHIACNMYDVKQLWFACSTRNKWEYALFLNCRRTKETKSYFRLALRIPFPFPFRSILGGVFAVISMKKTNLKLYRKGKKKSSSKDKLKPNAIWCVHFSLDLKQFIMVSSGHLNRGSSVLGIKCIFAFHCELEREHFNRVYIEM